MIVKEEGYVYGLETANGMPAIDIVFCRKVDGNFQDGITNEELINLLINRMTFMVKQKPTTENMNALTHMRQSKEWVNARSYKKLIKRKNDLSNDNSGNGVHVQAKG